MSRGRVNDIKFFLLSKNCNCNACNAKFVFGNCYLLSVICYLYRKKFVLGNCQLSTVTLVNDDIDYG